MKLTVALVLINLLLTHNVVFAQNSSKIDELKLDSEAPVFSLPDLKNNYVFLRDMCGDELRKPWINKEKKVVVLSFFATWCVPCEKEIPYLVQLKNKFTDQQVVFYLVNVGEDRPKVEKFLKDGQISLPVLLDQYKVVSEKYGANSLPRLVVIDKNGKVKKYTKGFSDPEAFIAEMEKLLNDLIQ